jgi:uncharacterized membrane protein YgcG
MCSACSPPRSRPRRDITEGRATAPAQRLFANTFSTVEKRLPLLGSWGCRSRGDIVVVACVVVGGLVLITAIVAVAVVSQRRASWAHGATITRAVAVSAPHHTTPHAPPLTPAMVCATGTVVTGTLLPSPAAAAATPAVSVSAVQGGDLNPLGVATMATPATAAWQHEPWGGEGTTEPPQPLRPHGSENAGGGAAPSKAGGGGGGGGGSGGGGPAP